MSKEVRVPRYLERGLPMLVKEDICIRVKRIRVPTLYNGAHDL